MVEGSLAGASGLIGAAQYLRMSTEHQRYSLEHQTHAIAAYARAHSYQIVRTYADAAKSGLRIRPALSELLKDVVGGPPEFERILVLDVSRWGRFQDPDEGAHYEFICRSAGVAVEYCAEGFENDGSLVSTLVKQLKRTMAAEYSRELSAKVSSVQRALAARGYRMCGPTGYGLRRVVLDEYDRPVGVLERRQSKAVQGYRVILAPGPPNEVATVRRIYRLFVRQGMTRTAISKLLNAEGVPAEGGGAWTLRTVSGVLSYEKYIGTSIWGRRTRLLRGKSTPTPPETWVRCKGAFQAIVGQKLFAQAQLKRAVRSVKMDDEAMLRALRRLLARQGFLSARLINDARGVPCVSIYAQRFGGLTAAYRLIGYDRDRALRTRCAGLSDAEMLQRLSDLLARRGYLSAHVINASAGLPSALVYAWRFGGLAGAYHRIGYDTAGTGGDRRRKDSRYSDAWMIEGLRRLFEREGRLSPHLVDADPAIPGRSSYVRRFGSLRRAYTLVGYRFPKLHGAAAYGPPPEAASIADCLPEI